MRKRVRDEMDQALAKSEDARAKRDNLCLYIAQHRMTGSERDIAQYISLALYLTPPPEMETSADLTEMPPDSTQVVGDCAPAAGTLSPRSTCTASGWRCITPTTTRPTGCTIRSRR